MQNTPKYSVGIDLGTTHTVVAYSPYQHNNAPEIQLFTIEQLINSGQVAALNLLPSVRYHAAEGELSASDIAFSRSLQLQNDNEHIAVIGQAARVFGSKSKGRFVTSAKSWLSHPSVDHSAAILPWGSPDEVSKVSPLEASASYLAHIRAVWLQRFPDAPLEQQDLVITVPASFDEGARSLTLEAARLAQLPTVRLLEEPQAVCYDWLRRHAANLSQALSDVHLLLVCDVGGGTTDLTLIKVEQGINEPKLTRIGVGEHLMLGGDNIDLTLAHLVEKRLGTEKRLSSAELAHTIEQCRIAKERLLAQDAPEQLSVTLLGGGSKLIGGSRSVILTREQVREIALNGFFPLSQLNELPDKKRSGVVEFGLPYTAEPAVSKHIAGFLKHHTAAASEALQGQGTVPDALLLNGGVFASETITARLVELISQWRGAPPVLLENVHPELAVAFGAVSYAIARRDKKLKIGGGSARSYFLVVDTDKAAEKQGICILPRGSEEGEEIILKNRRFALRLGVPVRFHLASTTGDTAYKSGDIIALNEDFHSLPPLAVAFAEQTSREVLVELAVTQTEVGTLHIQCVAIDNPAQRWNVEFQLRKTSASALSQDDALPPQFEHALAKIRQVFGAKSKDIDAKAVKNLRADLEKTLATPRQQWTTAWCRALFAQLLDGEKYRKRSEQHERVWLSLLGYCLRPGFGYPLDDWRVEQVWKLYNQGIQFVNETQNWAEWWTLWRRIAGGLSQAAQEQIFSDLSKFLNPETAKQAGVTKQLKTRSYDDMVRLSAVLERLPVAQKVQLGQWLLTRLEKPSEPSQTWWAVGRIGARQPFHSSSHNVIASDIAEQWLARLLKEDWKKTPTIGFAAMLLARNSGDRSRDLNEAVRGAVMDKLKTSKAPNTWIELVEHNTELSEKDEQQLFGEALPAGLKLVIEQ